MVSGASGSRRSAVALPPQMCRCSVGAPADACGKCTARSEGDSRAEEGSTALPAEKISTVSTITIYHVRNRLHLDTSTRDSQLISNLQSAAANRPRRRFAGRGAVADCALAAQPCHAGRAADAALPHATHLVCTSVLSVRSSYATRVQRYQP